MTLSLNTRGSGRAGWTRRGSAAVAAFALAAGLLVAACGAGGPGAAFPTMPLGSGVGGLRPVPSAPALPAVLDASPAAPSMAPSLTAPAIPGPARTPRSGTAAATAASSPTGAVVIAPSPSAGQGVASPASASAIDPRADGLDIVCGDVAMALETSAIRPGPVTLIIHNAGGSTAGFEMKTERDGGDGGGDERIETRTFGPGETLRVEADLQPGVYEAACSRRDQESTGQRTTLEVRADAPLVAASAAAAGRGTVRIVQFAFVAPALDVPAGTRVTWTNDDPAPHTVTADRGAFDSRQLDPGASFAVVLDRPGVYTYHCEIHRTMVGTLTVH